MLRQMAVQPLPQPDSRPTITPTVGYEVAYRSGAAELVMLRVSADGEGCAELEGSVLLLRTCTLARYLDPLVIAGEAFGNLNTEYTPSLEAIMWRARLTEGPMFCERAGLVDEFLSRCLDAATQETYTVEDGSLEVVVPSGT